MKHIILSFIFFAILNNAFAGAFYPGVQIGNAQSEVKTKFFKLENNALAATWIIVNQKISFQNFLNKETGLNINFKSSSSFFLEMEDGQRLYSKDFKTIAKPIIRNINVPGGWI